MDKNFTRLLDTLAIVPRGAALSTPQICQRLAERGHHVTPRTVQRDLQELAAVYPLECDERSKPFAWRWRQGAAHVSVPGMGWPEALAFYMLDRHLDGVMPASVCEQIKPYVMEARSKLAAHFHALPMAQWPRRVQMGQQPIQQAPTVKRAVHAAVTEAILLGRCLAIEYQAFESGETKPYEVAPLGLVQQGSVFYLPVRFAGHDDVRTLAMHRIGRVVMTEAASGIEAFDFPAWLQRGPMGFGGEGKVALRLRAFEDLPERLQEAPMADDQQLTRRADGSADVSATVQDTLALRRWLLAQGPRLEVLEPPELRAQMSAWLAEAAARYTAGRG